MVIMNALETLTAQVTGQGVLFSTIPNKKLCYCRETAQRPCQ